jgi:uncharacterized protein YjdB
MINMKHAKFAPIFLLFFLVTAWNSAFAAKVYSPASSRSMSAAKTYCVGASATSISFRYNTCNTGSGGSSGITMTVNWYQNSTNSTTGGTLVGTESRSCRTRSNGTVRYTPSTSAAGVSYYYCVITWTGAGSCNTSGTLTSATTTPITVSAAPGTIGGSNTACVAATTTYTNSATGGTWSSSNTARATIGSTTGVLTGVSAGTVTITYRVSCGSTATKVVTVSATPTVAATSGGTTKVCTGATTTLSNATSGGVWSSSNTAIGTVGTTGIVRGISSGITTISYAVSNSCGTVYATKDVTVTTTPAAISGSSAACAGYTLTYTNTVPYGNWTSSNTARATINSTTGVISALTAGTTLISYSTGCGAMATRTLTVNAGVPASTGTATVCAGSTTTLSNSVGGGTWESANASIATVGSTTGVVSGVATGTAAITYSTGGSCSAVTIVTVRATPASISGTSTICTGGGTTLLSNSTPYGTWSSSATSVASIGAATGIATGLTQGTTRITYTTGCGTSAFLTVNVFTQPAAIGGTASVCAGATTTFTNAVTGGTWSSANTSLATVGTSGIVTGVSDGLTTVTYTNGVCHATKSVTINPIAVPGTISGELSACDEDVVNYTTDGESGGAWSSTNTGVATIDAAGEATALVAGTTTISYAVTNSCGTVAATAVLTVSPTAAAGTISGTSTLCEGGSVTLSNSGASEAGAWSSLNTTVATVGTAGLVSGIAAGTSSILYTVTNGCGTDIDTFAVTVNGLPSAGTISGATSVCVGVTTALTNGVSGGAWTTSNSSVATVSAGGVVTGVASGAVNITYTTTNSCGTNYTTFAMTVNPLPTVASISGTASVCMGSTTTLANATSGGAWTSSSIGVATVSSGVVTPVSVGTTTISYGVTNGCGTVYATQVVTVNVLPGSISGTTTLCQGTTTALTNATTGGTWSTGNTSVATVVSGTGVVSGVAGGTSSVTYTTAAGCIATTVVTVTAAPVVTVPANQNICNGATQPSLSFTSSLSGTTYVWTNSNTTIGLTGTSTGTMCGTATENTNLVLTAPTGAVFTGVTFASYGTPTGSCGSYATSSCHAALSTTRVLSYIVGQSTATIPATNAVFGDPCSGTLKRLYVTATYSYTVIPSFTAANPGATPNVGTINVTPTANGCAGTPASFTISVDNINAPVAYTVTGGGAYCSGGSGSAVGLSNSTSGVNYQLWRSGVAVGSPVAGTGSAISFGSQTVAGTYTADAVNTTTGCTNTMSGSVTVSVNPVPTVSAISDKVVCNGGTQSSISLTGSLAGTVYSWTVDNSIGLSAGTTGTICGTANENGSVTLTAPAGTVFTSIDFASYGTPTGSCGSYAIGGCHASNSVTKVGTYLLGNNSGTIPATNAVFGDPCSGTVKRLYVQASYGVIPSFTAVNTSASPVVATVTVTPTKNGCAGTPGTFTITVDPTPTAYSVTGGGAYCATGAGVEVGLSGSQSGVNYQLMLGASSVGSPVAGTGSAISFGTFTTVGTYSVSASTAAASCAASMTGSATITSGTASAITGTLSVCETATTTLGNATSGGTWTSGNTSVATIGSASGVVTGVAEGTAMITYASGSCATVSVVTVNPLPVAGSISGTATVCESSITSLISSASGGAWSSSTASIATVSGGDVTGVAAGTTTISYTVSNGCGSASATQIVTVNPLPTAGAISGTATLCESSTTTLSNSVSGGAWSSGNASVATVNASGVVSGVAAGNADITYTYTNSCGTAFVYQVVTVNGLPDAGALSGSTNVCVSSTTSLSATVSGGAWTSSNNSVATVNSTGVVSGVSAGVATISYTSTTSCGTAYATHAITVLNVPSVASISGTAVMCASATTTLSNSVSGGVWSSANTSVATVGTGGDVSGVAAGTATISYGLSNSCGSSYESIIVTVNPSSATITGASTLCHGGTTTYTVSDAAGAWSSSSGSVASVDATTGVVSGMSIGSATISYTATSGCYVVTQVIGIFNSVADITGAATACAGSGSTLSCATGGGTWSTSDAAIATVNSSTGVVTAISAGSAVISYTTASGCFNTRAFVVYPMPEAITGVGTICTGSATVLYSTIGGSGTWTSSDVTVANPDVTSGMVAGVSVGTAVITYRIPASGCQVTTVVTVNETPAAITGANTLCAGSTSLYSNTTSGGTWSTNPSTVATINSGTGNATAVTAGVTTMSYVMPTGCFVTKTLTVNPLPANITYAANNICLGKTMNFVCATTGGTWTSSNTTVATIVSTTGVATSQDLGTTTITYALPTGCLSTTTFSIFNDVPAVTGADIIAKGASTTYANTASGGSWLSGNTSIASVNSVTGMVTGMNGGTTRISYRLTGGCLSYKTMTVAAITGAPRVCVGSTNTLTHLLSGTWSSGNTSLATIDAATGVITGVAPGNVVISYNLGGGTYNTQSIMVNSLPAAISGSSTVCAEACAMYTGTVGGSATWSSSNTSVATIGSTSGLATGISAGTAVISYIMPTSGCFTIREITVNAAPAAISGPSTACVGATVTLSNAVTGGTWASNPTTVATVGSTSGIVTGTSAGGVTVSYTLSNGCRKTKVMTVYAAPAVITGPSVLSPGSSSAFSCASSGGAWNVSDAAVAAITSSSGASANVAAVATGVAELYYTLPNGCSRSKSVSIVGAKSADLTETTDVAEFKLYPNPTSGTITIESSYAGSFAVYTFDGKKVSEYQFSANSSSVTLPAGLATGMYICQFVFENNSSKTVKLYYQN